MRMMVRRLFVFPTEVGGEVEVGSRLPLFFQKTFLWLVDGYQKEFYPPDFTGARPQGAAADLSVKLPIQQSAIN
jgi:hypothetical protein